MSTAQTKTPLITKIKEPKASKEQKTTKQKEPKTVKSKVEKESVDESIQIVYNGDEEVVEKRGRVRKERTANDYEEMKSQREHILKRSGMYIGSKNVIRMTERLLEFIPSSKQKEGAEKETVVPVIRKRENVVMCLGAVRIFMEILSNASDNLFSTVGFSEDTPSRVALLASRGDVISVKIDGGNVTIRSGGEPIPVVPTPESLNDSKRLRTIPDMIFGTLLSSSNYDEDVSREGAGLNGLGCKLTNIMSKKFSVTVADGVRGQRYHGVWVNNMESQTVSKTTPGYIFEDGKWTASPKNGYSGASYVEVSYDIDFSQFSPEIQDPVNTGHYHPDLVALFARLTFDCAFTTKFVTSFNGFTFDARTPRAFSRAYFPESEERIIIHYEWPSRAVTDAVAAAVEKKGGNKKDAIAKVLASRTDGISSMPTVELVVVDTPDACEAVGFVNGLCVNNGVHIWEALNRAATALVTAAGASLNNKKSVSSLGVADVRGHFSVIVNCYLSNPEFTSQNKTELASPRPKIVFGPDEFKLAITSSSEAVRWRAVQRLIEALETKERRAVTKTDAGQRRSFVMVENGEDANDAGKSNSEECTLYITEGESGAGQAKLRIGLLGGKDKNGYYPLKGKALNVSNASTSAIVANKELADIKMLVGLADGVDYTDTEVARKLLRYGRIIIASDQDVDGYHIRALVTNMFARWPSLFHTGRVAYLATPLVRVVNTKTRKCIQRFFCEASFDRWLASPENGGKLPAGHSAVYLKGLASSTPQDIEEDLEFSPCIYLIYDDGAKDSLSLAFDSKRANDRKEWIRRWKAETSYDDFEMKAVSDFLKNRLPSYSTKCAAKNTPETGGRRRKMVESVAETKDFVAVNAAVPTGRRAISQMINVDLAVYSADTLFRAIPNVFDGLKKSQRQGLYHALEYWNYGATTKEPVKIARLASAAAERVLYQHGETSMCNTYIGLAQNFVGSNNLTVLDRIGLFGTRSAGGKDAGAPRYIATALDKPAALLFSRESVALAPRLVVEGEEVEPKFLPCDLPLGVVNGCRGIATGFSSYIPPHNPVEVADWILEFIRRNGTVPEKTPTPWFRGFSGRVAVVASGSVDTSDELNDEDDEDTGSKCATGGSGRFTLVTEGQFEVTRHPTPSNPTYDVVITELPITAWTSSYHKMLKKWRADGKLGGMADNSTSKIRNKNAIETVKFTLTKLDTAALIAKKQSSTAAAAKKSSEQTAPKFPPPALTLEMLKLRKSFSLNQFTCIDETGIPTTYESVRDILVVYTNRMLSHYEAIKQSRISAIRASIDKANRKRDVIDAIVSGRLKVMYRKDSVVASDLEKMKLCAETYDALKMREVSETGLETLIAEIQRLEDSLKETIDLPSWRIWEKRLESFKNSCVV